MSRRTVAEELSDLSQAPRQILPLLASPGALPAGSQIGDEVRYRMCGRKVTFVVTGTASQWPTLSPPFLLTDLMALEASGAATCGQHELWISVRDGAYEDVLDHIKSLQEDMSGSIEVIADAQSQLHAYETDLVTQTATAAFRLNAVTLVILSSTSFLLLQILALRRRLPQLGILRALGTSVRQMIGLISLEGATVVTLGLLIGAGIGLILTHAMRSFLSFALVPSLGIYASECFSIDWDHIASAIMPMVGIDVLAMICLIVALLHADLHQTLRAVNE
jgi:putative ABC transport system permease protein